MIAVMVAVALDTEVLTPPGPAPNEPEAGAWHFTHVSIPGKQRLITVLF